MMGAAVAAAAARTAADPPVIVAAGAGEVAATTATVGVAVAPSDAKVTVTIDYGTSDAYGERAAPAPVTPSDDVTPVYRKLTHLTPATTYHFRFVLESSGGRLVGPDQTFTTLGASAPAGAAPVVNGLYPAVQRTHGRVRIRQSGSTFQTLPGGAALSLGSVVDARHGAVSLTSGLPDGSTQTARFHGGKFRVTQDVADGSTGIHLAGGSFARCGRASAARKRKRKRRVVRQLWSSDSGGLYSTYGLNSVATVRGTRWLTQDRCDGTLTKVVSGVVEVRDVRTGATTVVRAGHKHLSR